MRVSNNGSEISFLFCCVVVIIVIIFITFFFFLYFLIDPYPSCHFPSLLRADSLCNSIAGLITAGLSIVLLTSNELVKKATWWLTETSARKISLISLNQEAYLIAGTLFNAFEGSWFRYRATKHDSETSSHFSRWTNVVPDVDR